AACRTLQKGPFGVSECPVQFRLVMQCVAGGEICLRQAIMNEGLVLKYHQRHNIAMRCRISLQRQSIIKLCDILALLVLNRLDDVTAGDKVPKMLLLAVGASDVPTPPTML